MSVLVVAHSSLPILFVKISDASYHKLINWVLVQVKYYTNAGDRATSDAGIPIKPNSSIRFTGQTNVLAKLREHFTVENNDKLCR